MEGAPARPDLRRNPRPVGALWRLYDAVPLPASQQGKMAPRRTQAGSGPLAQHRRQLTSRRHDPAVARQVRAGWAAVEPAAERAREAARIATQEDHGQARRRAEQAASDATQARAPRPGGWPWRRGGGGPGVGAATRVGLGR